MGICKTNQLKNSGQSVRCVEVDKLAHGRSLLLCGAFRFDHIALRRPTFKPKGQIPHRSKEAHRQHTKK